MAELRLEAREFRDLTRWRWVLADASGSFLAGHEVRLDPASWEFEAFADLRGYVSWNAAPDRYRDDEARIVAGVGAWVGAHILGRSVSDALVEAARRGPVTVRVVVPLQARELLFRPLEIAHVHGRPLARQGITLVLQTGQAAAPSSAGDRLRVLGLFSLPKGGTPLNLRRERHSLVQFIHRIAASGKAADIRVLQYGVTRGRLRDVLQEAEGWDVIHVSGHGSPGQLLLETPSGAPDPVRADELADLLDLARERVKLVTVSACWSAADPTADQRRLLGLPASQERSSERIVTGPPSPGALATELAERLGCAVFAMRFPVDDEFAITLSGELYRLLAEDGQPLPRAVGMTLRELRRAEYPALSVAAPALFGGAAVGLTLAASPRRPGGDDYDPGALKMAGFPPQPDRFVGRTGVMARASAALAAESGVPGVLLHGMPGGGKTACALELAYTHEHAFGRLVWYKAPDEGMAIDGALTDFAITLERDLPGFQMAHLVADEAKLAAVLPTLTELVESRRVLTVIDNAESLLSDSGEWRDPRWGQVVAALTAHHGLGRVILTSRRVPAEASHATAMVSAETRSLRVEAVDALSASEGLLLARELPNLRKLIHRELPGIDPDAARKLTRGVLTMAQGHPKLLELADGQAADPERLATLIDSGEQAWRDQGGVPEGLFTTGESNASPEDYLHILATWTKTVTDTLTSAERDLFRLLCCLEEPDRELSAIAFLFFFLWDDFGHSGHPPELGETLLGLVTRGLIAVPGRPMGVGTAFAIHPAVAAAGRSGAGKDFQDKVDTLAVGFWYAAFFSAYGQPDGVLAEKDEALDLLQIASPFLGAYANTRGAIDAVLMARTGLAAVRYMARRGNLNGAATLLEVAFIQNPSRANAAVILPLMQQITRQNPRRAIILGGVLRELDPAAAEAQLRAGLDDAVARGDYLAASTASSHLSRLCQNTGRLTAALMFAERSVTYDRRADIGPWTRLGNKLAPLQIRTEMGHAEDVLGEVRRLRDHMDTLPMGGPRETVFPWRVREVLLSTGMHAAHRLERWQEALDFNAEVLASKRGRRAPAAEIAEDRCNDYGPLICLGRTEEALDLLLDCRQVFQDAHDTRMLGMVLTALASVEDHRGHGDAAIRLARDALRYDYLAGNTLGLAVTFNNLGNYLRDYARQPAQALASHLAADLIRALTEAVGTGERVREAATDLRTFGDAAAPPANVADLCHLIGDTPGTDLASLITRLASDAETAERTLRDLITHATKMAAED